MTTEQDVQRSLTETFIAAKPVSIQLIPSARVKTSTGGWKWQDSAARTAQTFRLLPQTAPLGERVVSEDGHELRSDYVLLGAYDAIVVPGDHWVGNGHVYRVLYLLPDNGYEVRAAVTVDAQS